MAGFLTGKSTSVWWPAITFTWLFCPFYSADGHIRQRFVGHFLQGNVGGRAPSALHQADHAPWHEGCQGTDYLLVYSLTTFQVQGDPRAEVSDSGVSVSGSLLASVCAGN